LNISGIVQGVGFRPFIWRTAKKLDLKGSVTNTTEGVLIKINVRDRKQLLEFISKIKKEKPAPSFVEDIRLQKIGHMEFNEFTITESLETDEKFQLISPDIATCSNCVEDIGNRYSSRRFYYPFTNCTNCGPRFTIITNMPYDRPNTTMRSFEMCPDCEREYNNPLDRRFHAQPNACKICGPRLKLVDNHGNIIDEAEPIQKATYLLKKDKIIGIKSLGGFQIACDATSDNVLKKIRKRKKRPAKPFALMFRDLNMIKKYLTVSGEEEKSLVSPPAPIVLLKKKYLPDSNAINIKAHKKSGTNSTDTVEMEKKIRSISYMVSFFNKYEGAFLPYTPIHHLLFKDIDFPLVMTSGNISEEPIASKNVEAFSKLSNICDYFLIHDRDIYSKYDDSVIKIFNNKEMVLRRARGYAPYPVKLNIDIKDKVILAVGAQEKNTFCILKKNYAILSQHIGDLETLDSYSFFKNTLYGYMELFGIEKFDVIVHDKHPDYTSSGFALSHFKYTDRITIQHHKAHIAGVIAENCLIDERTTARNDKKKYPIIGFAWDGTGYGDDGNIWGSEVFLIDKSLRFERIGHLLEKSLPGGEITIKKPYRMSLVYLYKIWKNTFLKKITFEDFIYNQFPYYRKLVKKTEIDILCNQIDREAGSPVTTSMGRLFDAVSSVLDLTHIISYESEAAVNLEMVADENTTESYDIMFSNEDPKNPYSDVESNKDLDKKIIDDFHIFEQIIGDIKKKIPVSYISTKFHNTLAQIILLVSLKLKKEFSADRIALAGGVFQNNLLLKKSFDILQENGFKVYSKFKVPVNDGGISLGQAYLAAKKMLDS